MTLKGGFYTLPHVGGGGAHFSDVSPKIQNVFFKEKNETIILSQLRTFFYMMWKTSFQKLLYI